jgi:hypothetical protein
MRKLVDAENADQELNGRVSAKADAALAEIEGTVERHRQKLSGGEYWIFYALLADRLKVVAKEFSERAGITR